MRRLRISGLVKFVKRVRQELSGPVSPERLALLRRQIDENIGAIEQIARDKDVHIQSLPLPSRKAYHFLKGLDWNAVVCEESFSRSSFPPDSVSFRGLQRHFDNVLDRLARAVQSAVSRPSWPRRVEDVPPSNRGQDARDTQGRDTLATAGHHRQREEIYEIIRADSASIEEEIRAQNIHPEQLKRPAREMRGWLAYFSERENSDEYCTAVRRAEPIFREACTWPAAKSAAILVHFRPQQGMYRVRGYSDAIVVHLPTPMICFDETLLRSVAQVAFKRSRDRKAPHEGTTSEPYRKIASALELLGGVVTQMRGMHHDLAAAFDRVNAAYFKGGMSRPHLVWSRTFAARKFGHYDHAHDTVMVNMVLDGKTVPEFAVDFIVYHELLHKQLGILWQSNRMAAHTPEFRERERAFKQYDQAKAVLRKLALER